MFLGDGCIKYIFIEPLCWGYWGRKSSVLVFSGAGVLNEPETG